MKRNWKDIKNKPSASKQLFLTVHEFTVFSNKCMSLWLKLVRKCDLEEQPSVSQEFPLGHGHGQPVHATSTHCATTSPAAKQKVIYFL